MTPGGFAATTERSGHASQAAMLSVIPVVSLNRNQQQAHSAVDVHSDKPKQKTRHSKYLNIGIKFALCAATRFQTDRCVFWRAHLHASTAGIQTDFVVVIS